MTVWAVMGVPEEVVTETSTVVLVSGFSPVLVKFAVNVGAGLAATVFPPPVESGTPLTLTLFSASPQMLGQVPPPADEAGSDAPSLVATVDGVSQPRSGRKLVG